MTDDAAPGPDSDDVDRVTRALAVEPAAWHETPGHGAAPNDRWLVRLPTDQLIFVKIAGSDLAADRVRTEHATYDALDGLPFLPRLIGWDDDGVRPVLAIESFADAAWPPPWTPEGLDAVRAALDEVHAQPAPDHARDMSSWREELVSWPSVLEDPEPVLRLGVCSRGWLTHALPSLLVAEAEAPLEGEALLHMNVRSDNLCLTSDRAVLVDWDLVSRGDPVVDLAFALPIITTEGGPPPEDLLPDCPPGLAAIAAGSFATFAPMDHLPPAPHLREPRRAHASVALAWAARLLDLPPPA